jgi:hypothetical protein
MNGRSRIGGTGPRSQITRLLNYRFDSVTNIGDQPQSGDRRRVYGG